MTGSEIAHVSLNCPHCGASNHVNSDSGTDGLNLHCSKCNESIGRLGELKQLATERDPEPRRA